MDMGSSSSHETTPSPARTEGSWSLTNGSDGSPPADPCNSSPPRTRARTLEEKVDALAEQMRGLRREQEELKNLLILLITSIIRGGAHD